MREFKVTWTKVFLAGEGGIQKHTKYMSDDEVIEFIQELKEYKKNGIKIVKIRIKKIDDWLPEDYY